MADKRYEFRELLQDLLEQAEISGGILPVEEVEQAFADFSLDKEQMEQVYGFLSASHVTLRGYVPTEEGRATREAYEKAARESLEAAAREEARKVRKRSETGEGFEDVREDGKEPEEDKKAEEDEDDEDERDEERVLTPEDFLEEDFEDAEDIEPDEEEEESATADEDDDFPFAPDLGSVHVSHSVKATGTPAADQGEVPEIGAVEEEDSISGHLMDVYLEELGAIDKLDALTEEILLGKIMTGDGAAMSEYLERKLHDVVALAASYEIEGAYMEELVGEGNVGLVTAVTELCGGPRKDAAAFVTKTITDAMDTYIHETMQTEDRANAMVAKVGYLSEAARTLTERNGESPSVAQLAAYTNLSEDEIADIMNLASDDLKEKKDPLG